MAESVQSLKDRACRKTGLTNFGRDFSEEPLRAWAEDLQSPRLNETGRATFTSVADRAG